MRQIAFMKDTFRKLREPRIKKGHHSSNNEFLQKFNEAFQADYRLGHAKDWMAAWYWKELCPQFGDSKGYKGPVELVNWYVGQSTCRTYYDNIRIADIKRLAQIAIDYDKKIFSNDLFYPHRDLIDKIDFLNYSIYTAQDYFFQTLLPLDQDTEFRTVVDFGAGSGRQFALWNNHPGLNKFISIDGIPQTYCTQNLYYSLSGVKYYDYVFNHDQFNLEHPDSFALFHLPSWRLDLIPDNSVDLIITVQVLGELRPQMLKHCLSQFHRILRKSGRLYIRDHGMHHCPNKIDIPAEVSRHGFALELHPRYADRQDIWGIPKVWAKC